MQQFLKVHNEVLQTPVFTLENSWRPPITLIGEVHVGMPDYFAALEAELAPGQRHYAGFEMLREPQATFTSRRHEQAVQRLKESLDLRAQLARSVGLVSRRDVGAIPNAQNVDVTMSQLVGTMSWLEKLSIRIGNGGLKRLLETSNNGAKALEQDVRRRERVRHTFLQQQRINNPNVQQVMARKNRERDKMTLSYISEAIEGNRVARQVVGVAHLPALIELLGGNGYKVTTIRWLDCVDLEVLL